MCVIYHDIVVQLLLNHLVHPGTSRDIRELKAMDERVRRRQETVLVSVRGPSR